MNAVISTTSSSSSPTQGLLSSTVNASMVHQSNVVATTAGGATVITSNSLGLHDDALRSPPSTPESEQFDDSDLLTNAAVANDEVTQRLMVAGTVGLAAAAAIATGKKRKRPHCFETDPSIRRRQQTRLLRELKATIDEYTTRIGQQAVVMIVTPGKPNDNFKVFGAQPLENVMRDLLKSAVIQELENALAQHAPAVASVNGTGTIATGSVTTNGSSDGVHDLPPLVIDGIPTPVEKMTQAQLRCFIPLMLKYSTGRGKPGWGRESTRPPWWPQDLPWANVRSDVRSDEDKQRVSWTHALRQIVINCYRYHGREDLLPAFGETTVSQQPTVVHSAAEIDDDNKATVIRAIQASASSTTVTAVNRSQSQQQQQQQQQQGQTAQIVSTAQGQTLIQVSAETLANAQTIYSSNGSIYGTTMVQAINNPDGTVSIIQVDPNTAMLTLPDGTQAQLRAVSSIQQGSGQTDSQVLATDAVETQAVEMAGTDAVATLENALSQGSQIILTGEDGTQSGTFSVSGMVAIPVSMYHHQPMQVMQSASSASPEDGDSLQVTQEGGGDSREIELVTGND
ncbi:DNA-binding protein P3A2 [Galendromus occidentalis]|uniref:DNA-binding protein P3A2 n=1 Tax=Galendromus occidentalis TaxID=34638 RepID=A0AAJ7SHL5_9ACAR|nr:DNA-binding protein P3A2 [Galendromus occidentalis]